MHFTTVQVPSFPIAGLSIRTANAEGRAMKEISELWQKFMAENVLQTIQHRHSDDIYCMYTEYESDANAPYTVILGCRVDIADGLKGDIITKTIPAATYRLYQPVGPLPGSITSTWVHIWQSTINRAYRADFDVYKPGGAAEIYLSVIE